MSIGRKRGLVAMKNAFVGILRLLRALIMQIKRQIKPGVFLSPLLFCVAFAIIANLLFCIASAVVAKQPERYYQEAWCEERGGETEVVLKDRTRVDCLTDEYAIEFDFARKWAEAVGQSLYYAVMTKKKPGIVLIMSGKKDRKYLKRLDAVIREYRLPVRIWKIKAE